MTRTVFTAVVILVVGLSANADPPGKDSDKPRDDATAEAARLREQIVQDMQAAESKLKTPNAGSETQQLQDRAIRNIDRLIEMLRNPQPQSPNQAPPPMGDAKPQPKGMQPPQGAQSQLPNESRQSRRERRQQQTQGRQNIPQQMPGGSNQQTGQPPQRDVTPPDAARADKLADMSKDAWGHLPESLRKEVDHYYRDRFMPHYRDLLQEYYKRLAEQERGTRRDR